MNNSFFDEMHKIANEEMKEHPALTAAKGVGGFALGAGAGYGATHAVDKGVRALGGKGLSPGAMAVAGPLAGAASGIGFNLLQKKMMDRMSSNMGKEEDDDVT